MSGAENALEWTPLAGAHLALRARLGEVDGRSAVLEYGSPIAEHGAVRTAAGLLDLTARGRFEVRGADRVGFLQRMLSNDVEHLAPGEGRHALFLTDRGHILLDLAAYRMEDVVLLETDAGLRPAVGPTLDHFVVMDDVTIADVTDRTAHLSLQGPAARRILDGARLLPSVVLDALYRHARVDAETVHPLVVRRDRFGEEGYDLIVPREQADRLWNELLRVGGPLGLGPVGETATEMLRLETSLPRWGREFGEEALPVEVGLEDALDYEKGCYSGQEAVARATFVGRPHWTLAACVMEDGAEPPPPGTRLRGEGQSRPQTVTVTEPSDTTDARARRPRDGEGVVTSSASCPSLGRSAALAIVRREVATPGTTLLTTAGIRATVRARPLHRGRGLVPIAEPHPLAR